MKLPPATPVPCDECPWRVNSIPGYLGPFSADEWVELAMTDEPIACHKTIKEVDENGIGHWNHPAMRQCAGAASFRGHVCKSPRDPQVAVGPENRDVVFEAPGPFITHHTGEPRDRWGRPIPEAADA